MYNAELKQRHDELMKGGGIEKIDIHLHLTLQKAVSENRCHVRSVHDTRCCHLEKL